MERDVLRKIQAQQQKTTPNNEAEERETPFNLRTADPLQLQQMIGNKATSQLLTGGGAGPVVQTKMTVTDANDAHEKEADAVAEQIISGGGEADSVQRMDEEEMSLKRLQRSLPAEETPAAANDNAPAAANDNAPAAANDNAPAAANDNAPVAANDNAANDENYALAAKRIQRMGDDASMSDDDLAMKRIQREEEEESLQMKRIQREATDMSKSFDVGGDIEEQIQNTSGGASLDPAIQTKMEQGTGQDFSNVKVHTDSNADALSESLGARAFTTGTDIFFKQGEYNPSSEEGQKLIAHEGTHVIQQGGTQLKREDD